MVFFTFFFLANSFMIKSKPVAGLSRFLKGLKKIKRGAEDYYTAEDDFWKIFTFLGEKSRLAKSYENAGLRLGQEFIDANGAKQIFNDQ